MLKIFLSEFIFIFSSSEFLQRSAQEHNWVTLDWLLNENNLVKILEGRYDNKPVKTQKQPNKKPVRSIAEILEQHNRQNSNAIDAEYTLIKSGEGEAVDGERPPGFQ